MVDITSFRARYPVFTVEAFADDVVTPVLNESQTLLNESNCGSKYEILIFLLMAHELTLISSNGTSSGVVASHSIEGGGVSYKNTATNDRELYYSKTTYGQKYLAVRKTIRFVGAVCT